MTSVRIFFALLALALVGQLSASHESSDSSSSDSNGDVVNSPFCNFISGLFSKLDEDTSITDFIDEVLGGAAPTGAELAAFIQGIFGGANLDAEAIEDALEEIFEAVGDFIEGECNLEISDDVEDFFEGVIEHLVDFLEEFQHMSAMASKRR